MLAAIVARIRDTSSGTVPDVIAYDRYECCFLPPMPVLFQHLEGIDRRPLSPASIRHWIRDALAAAGITDNAGKPLVFTPHDFRRIFATEAIMNGMPPHITQLILGHKDITTTMGYKAVYPGEAIESHRAFIAGAANCGHLRNTARPPSPSGRNSSGTSRCFAQGAHQATSQGSASSRSAE